MNIQNKIRMMRRCGMILVCVMWMNGCGESDSSAEAQLTPLIVSGTLTTTLNDEEVVLDYEGMEAVASITHLKSSTEDGYACITEASLTVAKENGTCPLELTYRPGFEGEGLVLRSAKFYAEKGIRQDGVIIDTLHCEDWPDESASGEVIYNLSDGEGSINLKPIAAPESTQDHVNILGKTLTPEGEITLKFRALGSSVKEFVLDLSQLTLTGDVVSTGMSEGKCARYFEPYPGWELPDVNETSPHYGGTYGLMQFQGKIVVVLLSASWCAKCVLQVEVLEQLRQALIIQGRDDVQFAVILDKGSADDLWAITGSCDYPVFLSTDTLNGWTAQDSEYGGERSLTWVYNSDGTLTDSVDNPWLKGIGVPINLTEFKADINKVIQKALKIEDTFQAQ